MDAETFRQQFTVKKEKMMRLAILLFILFGAACATKDHIQSSRVIRYDQVRSLNVGQMNESQVIELFGQPDQRINSKDYYTFMYNDPITGDQRLSLDFLNKDTKLINVLWLPRWDERESFLDKVRADFKNATFKETRENNENPHALSLPALFYMDKNLGVTIRYSQKEKRVEAISIYSVSHRLPAEAPAREHIPYTL
jgi:hypothetical protein